MAAIPKPGWYSRSLVPAGATRFGAIELSNVKDGSGDISTDVDNNNWKFMSHEKFEEVFQSVENRFRESLKLVVELIRFDHLVLDFCFRQLESLKKDPSIKVNRISQEALLK